MVTIVEWIEVVLSGMLSLISPEKTADKINDTNISKSAKRISIVLFTLMYVAALALRTLLIQSIVKSHLLFLKGPSHRT